MSALEMRRNEILEKFWDELTETGSASLDVDALQAIDAEIIESTRYLPETGFML